MTVNTSLNRGPVLAERLARAAANAGLDVQSGGDSLRVALPSGACELSCACGWLSAVRPWRRCDGVAGLSTHADWPGPARYDRNGAAVVRLELPIEESGWLDANDWAPPNGDDDSASFAELLRQIPNWMSGRADEAWAPPPAEQLSAWLAESGHVAAIDESGSLHTVLKRKGCDGQVRIERRTGRLRMSMRLGAWRDLPEPALNAMRKLVEIANHRTRLVRHVWHTAEGSVRCEGVVDLSGLPLPGDSDPPSQALWPAVLSAAMDGLQLALNRLGLELDALADPQNRDLAEAFHDAMED